MTRIMVCTCQHEFQSKVYGPHLRVHNSMHPSGGSVFNVKGWRCTVCEREKNEK